MTNLFMIEFYDNINRNLKIMGILMIKRKNEKHYDRFNQKTENKSVFEQLLDSTLWQVETNFWEELKKDFPREIASVNKCLMVLRGVDNYLSEKIFNKGLDPYKIVDTIRNQQAPEREFTHEKIFPYLLINPEDINIGVCYQLCAEALNRLIAARLLLFTGHLSRVLSCIRDMYECLRVAEVCRTNQSKSKKWLKGKRVKWNKDFVFPPQINENGKNTDFFNKYGTHAYYEAASMVTTLAHLIPELNKFKEVNINYYEKCLVCFGFIFFAIQDILEYFVIAHADRITITDEMEKVYKLVFANTDAINHRLEELKK